MRKLATLAAAIAAVPSAALPALAETAAFIPPDGPITLTRTIRRALPDGKEVVATRSYELRIARDGQGYRVDGRLLAVEVQAPPALDALAAIERQRSDEGMFPFRLDAQGLIDASAAAGDRASLEAARTSAHQSIAQGPLPQAERREAEAFVGQIVAKGAAGLGAQWPADLFHAALGRRTTAAAVSLPGGQAGTVTTAIEVTRESGLERIERTVVTETGGNRRTTREVYTLARGHR